MKDLNALVCLFSLRPCKSLIQPCRLGASKLSATSEHQSRFSSPASETNTGRTYPPTPPTHTHTHSQLTVHQNKNRVFGLRCATEGRAPPPPPSKDERLAVRGTGVSQISEALATFTQHKRPLPELMGPQRERLYPLQRPHNGANAQPGSAL